MLVVFFYSDHYQMYVDKTVEESDENFSKRLCEKSVKVALSLSSIYYYLYSTGSM